MSSTKENAFGRRLKRIRQAAGLPLEALEWHTNLSRQYIHDLEMGRRKPSLETIEALAQALLVSSASLQGKEEAEVLDLSKHWKVARKKAMAIAYERAALASEPTTEAERVARKWMVGMSRKFLKEAERLESSMTG